MSDTFRPIETGPGYVVTPGPAGFRPSTGLDFYDYQLQAVGMYQRLREQVSSYNAPMYDMTNGLPFKVTDVITQLLNSAGFPPSMLDIPDLPVRMYSTGGGFHEQIDALSELGETVLTLIDQYLNHYLYWDENAGAFGKWKLIAPTTAPYTNKAHFVFDSSSVAPSGVSVETYQGTYASASTPTTFVRRGSFKSWVKPPETNLVIVSCMGKTTPSNNMPHEWFQVFPNFKSADFGNGLVDTSSPDYLGRIVPMYVMLPQFASIVSKYNSTLKQWEHPALNFVGRRIYDVAAHAIKTCSFQAPLLLIPHEDDSSNRRPLRYYDPVLVDGEQFLIRNVNPTYSKDFIQMAMYECEAPRI